jgi:hypothetical protein
MRATLLIAATCAAIVAAAALAVAGNARGGGPPQTAAPDGSRIATVRVYQGGKWTARGESAADVGAALAQLEPSYVSALLRFKAGERVTAKEIAAWNTITDAVRAANPDAKFDIELNGLEFPTIKKLNAMMSKIRAAFDNDGWLFDFYTPAAKRYPKVMAAAVASAHANGEFVGGNAFGIAKSPTVPAGTDYLAVQDWGFRIDLHAVRKLSEQAPIFFHLGNSPGFPTSDGCVFIEKYGTKDRVDYVTRRAGQQAAYAFRFAYPVFFPECARDRGTPRAEIFTYNATNDSPMMETIGQLMEQYD